MTTADPYVMIPASTLEDPALADVEGNLDHELLGWRVHLEVLADAAWPAAAFIPAGCPDRVLARLRDHEALVPFPAGRFRLPAYDAARETRTRKAAIGGTARAEQAERTTSGRFTSTSTSERGQRSLASTAGSETTSDAPQRPTQPPYNPQPKKNDVLDEGVDGTNSARVDVDPVHLSEPNRAGRPRASSRVNGATQLAIEDEYPASAWRLD